MRVDPAHDKCVQSFH